MSSNALTSKYPQLNFYASSVLKRTASFSYSGLLCSFVFCSSLQVEKLVLIDASVYAEGTGNLATLPTAVAYAGVSIFLAY